MAQLPSIKALQAFKAVSHYGGIRAAASELCITQSAVSHQIRQLEDILGIALFDKKGRHLVLNETGRNYLQHVSSTLHHLEQATTQVSRYQKAPPLTIAAPPSFITNWLLPNLGQFESEYPGTPIRLLQQLTLDKSDRNIDVAIEYRFQAQPGLDSQLLFMDDLSVLAAPSYVEKHPISSVDDLRNVRLIETEKRLISWLDVLWDKPWVKSQPFFSVPFSLHSLNAARLGFGVALGNKLNAQSMLDEKSLIIPFELDVSRKPEMPKYFMTLPDGKGDMEHVRRFSQWMRTYCLYEA